jgi:hypothetical protein
MYLLRDFFDVLGEDGSSGKKPGLARGAGKGAGANSSGPASSAGASDPNAAQVDAILDKIRQQGSQSLSEAERKILAEATSARQQEAKP